jgi:hypothetical protein
MNACVYVVHCVDTEGPLYESLDATFERLNHALGLQLSPSREILRKIQANELDLGGKTKAARAMVDPALLDCMQDWGQLDAMLDELLSTAYRSQFSDSTGAGWVFSWFILDHVGYLSNPRRRDIGYHNIFDHYRRKLEETSSHQDEVHWHFHPMSHSREAHVCATSYLNSPHLLEGLARRVIDRQWFPVAFRAGFHAERPDSHWFLEQWIPLDYSNQAMPETELEREQQDISGGRFGDWRRAPSTWSAYHPSHEDYQVPGDCNRVIFRCLNVGTRLRLLTQEEVDRAFQMAQNGRPAVLAFCNHDWRDMRRDVQHVYSLLNNASARFDGVTWKFAGARQAARRVLGWTAEPSIQMTHSLAVRGDVGRLTIETDRPTFGPQPFLAIKTWDQRYLTDNLDVQEPRRRWTYTFDRETIRLPAIETIGIAVTAGNASCAVRVLDSQGVIQRVQSH